MLLFWEVAEYWVGSVIAELAEIESSSFSEWLILVGKERVVGGTDPSGEERGGMKVSDGLEEWWLSEALVGDIVGDETWLA